MTGDAIAPLHSLYVQICDSLLRCDILLNLHGHAVKKTAYRRQKRQRLYRLVFLVRSFCVSYLCYQVFIEQIRHSRIVECVQTIKIYSGAK